jgi:hypothetical protein
MSVKKNLKEKTNVNIVDFLETIFPNAKTKYYELFLRIIENKVSSSNYDYTLRNNIDYIKSSIPESDDIEERLKKYNPLEISLLSNFISFLYSDCNFEIDTLNDFIILSEKNVIKNNDVTTYKEYDEILKQMSIINLKQDEKELENQIIKLYENDENGWLVIKPLSCLSSVKYGYGTRWCTAMKTDFDYFRRYTNSGVLIYCINKINGEKVAAFKDISENNEYSFWTASDKRVDSMQTQLPYEVIKVISNDFSTCEKTNKHFLVELTKDNQELFNKYYLPDISEKNVLVKKLREVPDEMGGVELPLREFNTMGRLERNTTGVERLEEPNQINVDY